MNSTTVEELLKPRYKVMKSYPSSNFETGEIITLSIGEDRRFETAGVKIPYCYHAGNGATAEYELTDYPDIFRKLEWWEDRDEKDMPEYVKHNGKVYHVDHWDETLTLAWVPNYTKDIKVRECQPATELEYTTFLNSNK